MAEHHTFEDDGSGLDVCVRPMSAGHPCGGWRSHPIHQGTWWMGSMADLIAFFRARLDDEEQVASAADPGRHRKIVTDTLATASSGVHHQVAHIARWDPHHVLVLVKARREVAALAESAIAMADEDADSYTMRGAAAAYLAAIKRLTAPYADHPDYRQEWRP